MKTDPRVDLYLANAAPFAQPLLKHLRLLVHRSCPEAEEAIKWNMPMFTFQGKLFCAISAFKGHCRFMIFGPAVRARMKADGLGTTDEPGSFGKLTSVGELPSDREITKYLRLGSEQIAQGRSPMARKQAKTPKPAPKIPAPLAAALKRNRGAATTFSAMSPSCQREYVEWITGAKREETKARRIEQAIEWLAQGKQFNWKYKR